MEPITHEAHSHTVDAARALLAEKDADLAALRELLALCQEQRLLLRDVAEVRGVQAREHAEQRARAHWRTVVSYLETLALNVPSPGAAVAGRLTDLTSERDDARARAEHYIADMLRYQLQMLQMAETLRQAVQAETIDQWVHVQDVARHQLERAAPALDDLEALLAAVGAYLAGPGAVEHQRMAAAYDNVQAWRAER